MFRKREKMHILFIIPSLGFGGAERVVSNLANEFIKENDVSIVLTSGNAKSVYSLDERINLFTSSGGGAIKIWSSVRKICKQIKPDVAIAFMTGVGIMSAIFLAGTGIPVIVSERNDPSNDSVGSSMVKLLGKISPMFTTGYVFQSEGARDYYPKYIQKKSCIILNPMNVEKIPERDRKMVDNRIVTVGRLHSQKNHRMLINAFAKSKISGQYTLHIYGDGELRSDLEKQINALDMSDRIFLEGSSNRVHEEIKDAKLFVFTSDYEGLPNALMEAMAIGLPCISTDCSPGGARMLINNGENGIIIPCGDEQRLADEFNAMFKDSDCLERLGDNAKHIRDRCSISAVSKEWLESIKRFASY